MQLINVNRLVAHPRNAEFFDDITGDAWETFKESIRTSGVIEPVIVTKDNVIVSGHQRVRACKELGIKEVITDFRDYKSDDAIIKDLIETNIRQRGVGNTNPVKFGRCLMELERIYGIHQGNGSNQYEQKPNNSDNAKSQEDLASELGISVDTLNNYKKLATSIPEIQSLVESGKVTKSVALSLTKRLSEEEQKQLVEMLPVGEDKISSRKIEFYEERVKKLTEENNELRNKPTKTITETIEVVPDDYEELKLVKKNLSETLKEANDSVNAYKKDYENVFDKCSKLEKKLKLANEALKKIKSETPENEYKKQLQGSAWLFCAKVASFLEDVGGYVWLSDKINELDNQERRDYIRAVNAVKGWADTLDYNINNKTEVLS